MAAITQENASEKKGTSTLKPYFIGLVVAWTVLILFSLLMEIRLHHKDALKFATLQNKATYDKDIAYRRWAAKHGGVYVPVTEETPPNPYLSHIPERDITTPSGRRLTLMNPAYMTRQVFEQSRDEYGVHAHITSLNPINPLNAADAWERKALESFAQGAKEAVSEETINGKPYMRLMMPMYVEKPCLKCHESQGYKLGDVRGGISVISSLESFLQVAKDESIASLIWYSVIWLLGFVGLFLGYKRLGRQFSLQGKIESNLRISEQRHREAQEMAKVGNWELDLRINEIYWSDEVYRIFEMDPKLFNASYEGFLSAVHPDDREMVNVAYRKAVEKNVPYDIVYRVLTPLGNVKHVHAKSREIHDEKGETIRSVGTLQDVTELKEAEVALTESERLFRAIFNQAADSVLLIDADTGTIVEFNDMAHESYGYTREEFAKISLNDIEVLEDVEGTRRHISKVLREGKDSFETKHRNKKGELLDVQISVQRLELKGKTFLVTIWRNVTEQKETLRRLQELNLNLEKLVEEEVRKNRSKDRILFEQARHIAMAELLVNLAHQWRQPLCAIGTIAQDVEDAFQHNELDEPYIRNSVGLIQKEVTDLSETINQFRSFFIAETEAKEFKVGDAVRKALAMVEETARRNDLEIAFTVLEDAPVLGYLVEFSQAIYNILKNSAETCSERNIKQGKAEVLVSRNPKSGKARLEISDNCGGIQETILDKVFDPYYTTRSKVRGKGVGLFMTKTIIESNMQGTIHVSNDGAGVKFIIEV